MASSALLLAFLSVCSLTVLGSSQEACVSGECSVGKTAGLGLLQTPAARARALQKVKVDTDAEEMKDDALASQGNEAELEEDAHTHEPPEDDEPSLAEQDNEVINDDDHLASLTEETELLDLVDGEGEDDEHEENEHEEDDHEEDEHDDDEHEEGDHEEEEHEEEGDDDHLASLAEEDDDHPASLIELEEHGHEENEHEDDEHEEDEDEEDDHDQDEDEDEEDEDEDEEDEEDEDDKDEEDEEDENDEHEHEDQAEDKDETDNQ
mmetsp:Transcript_30324/g.53274  ORF Transcript_30324/g.53274 Transcript_30324/m.53274 type:complete len:264 (-) Transcript_30324:197-988(-)